MIENLWSIWKIDFWGLIKQLWLKPDFWSEPLPTPLSNATNCNSIRPSISVLWRETWTHLITITTLFTFEAESCKNFKEVFLKTLFFKSSTSKAYISESFTIRRLGKISIDPKFYLVLGSGHNSIPQKLDLFRWMYTYISFEELYFMIFC